VPHLDPDRLVLLALSDVHADATETDHLASCAACRGDVESLQQVAELGAETQGLIGLPPPPEHVWQGIQDQIHDPAAVRPTPATAPKPRRRWLAPVLSAAAAAVLAVAGTVTVIRLTDRPVAPDVTARATLAPLALAPPTAVGLARILSGDELALSVRNLPLTTGYYEVWLIDPENLTKMIAVGNLAGSTGVVLPLPPGADLNRYRLVDISAEAYDGNAAHSGKSLLRGTLTS
jgi:hypothetical protein